MAMLELTPADCYKHAAAAWKAQSPMNVDDDDDDDVICRKLLIMVQCQTKIINTWITYQRYRCELLFCSGFCSIVFTAVSELIAQVVE